MEKQPHLHMKSVSIGNKSDHVTKDGAGTKPTTVALQKPAPTKACKYKPYDFLWPTATAFTVSCYATAIYGIVAGFALRTLWQQYSKDRINADCNGQYDEFRRAGDEYNKRGSHMGHYANALIICGIVQLSLFVAVCPFSVALVKCYYNKDKKDESLKNNLVLMYKTTLVNSIAIGIVIGVVFWVYFIECVSFFKQVKQYCAADSVIYGETREIMMWLYPLAIYEIIKGSFTILALVAFTLCHSWIYKRCAAGL